MKDPLKPVPHSRRGGLTIVPMPGFEGLARCVADKIHEIGNADDEDRMSTPVDIATPAFGYRSSMEPYLQLGKRHVGGHDCVVIGSGPGTDQMLIRTMMLLRYLAGRRAGRIALASGYFPLSRSDKDEGGLEFALPPFVIEMLRAAATGPDVGLSRIIAADLHAPQVVMGGTTGLIVELSMTGRVVKRAVEDAVALGNPIVTAFPDDGAQKRSVKTLDALERELNIPLPSVCGVKRRTSSTESRLLQVFGNTDAIRGATVLCLDDEIATGGTNIATAKAMKEHYGAAHVFAVVTHGVLSGDADARFAAADCPVDRIYCADTIPVSTRPNLAGLVTAERLVEVSWASTLAWAIYNHHWDLSIREADR